MPATNVRTIRSVQSGPAEDKSTSAKMKGRFKELDKGFRDRRDRTRRGPLEDGWDAAEMKRGNLWVYGGYDDETEYRKSLNISRSNWFRYRRLAEGLCKLEKAEFLKLVAENAEHLCKLPEDKRYNKDLIKKAQNLTEEEFEKVVNKFRAKEERVDEGEISVVLKFRMPLSMRDFIVGVMDKFIEDHELEKGNYSQAFHLMCAELQTGDHVRTKVMQGMPKLKQYYDLTGGKNVNLAADEILSKTHSGIGEYIRETSAAAGIQ